MPIRTKEEIEEEINLVEEALARKKKLISLYEEVGAIEWVQIKKEDAQPLVQQLESLKKELKSATPLPFEEKPSISIPKDKTELSQLVFFTTSQIAFLEQDPSKNADELARERNNLVQLSGALQDLEFQEKAEKIIDESANKKHKMSIGEKIAIGLGIAIMTLGFAAISAASFGAIGGLIGAVIGGPPGSIIGAAIGAVIGGSLAIHAAIFRKKPADSHVPFDFENSHVPDNITNPIHKPSATVNTEYEHKRTVSINNAPVANNSDNNANAAPEDKNKDKPKFNG